jgi:DNA-directed RNA polymerase sigma subunit (sigma70/sigma32)
MHNSVKQEALARIEDSARTLADFENVAKTWDKIEKYKDEYREEKEWTFGEIGETRGGTESEDSLSSDELRVDRVTYLSENVFPPPIRHRLWRAQMSGNFHDTIFDCPYEIDELVSNQAVSQALKELNDNQKEVLYFRIIREWTPQKIADIRGQTDRNIRRIYDMAIENLRRNLRKKQ